MIGRSKGGGMSIPKWTIAAIAMAVIAAAGWYFGSPPYTLSRMKSAAEAGNSDALAGYVDFPALREDLKAELMAKMAAEARKDTSGFGGLGLAFGSAMIGPLVDGFVSPAGLRAAFIAKRNDAAKPKPAGPVQVADKPVIKRRGLSEFLLASEEEPNSGLVFTRHGLGWKLSGVDMPPAAASGGQPKR
jgi:hypothetical protein